MHRIGGYVVNRSVFYMYTTLQNAQTYSTHLEVSELPSCFVVDFYKYQEDFTTAIILTRERMLVILLA
jgi:hypothetical protein